MDNNQTIEDFQFTLTPNQPVFFRAFYGGGNETSLTVPPFQGVGSLVCFAVDDQGANQIRYNHLYGNAMIQMGEEVVFSPVYNAYSFAAPNGVQGASIGTPGQLALDGSVYDACPQYLVTNFFAAPSFGEDKHTVYPLVFPWRPDLTLWPCRQDLRQDRTPTCTKAKFDVWNANEVKFTGAYQCFKCFYEGFLDEIGFKTPTAARRDIFGDNTQRGPGFGWEKFTIDGLDTVAARMRVQSIASSVCDGKIRGCGATKTVNTPLLGVMMHVQDSGIINSNNAKIPIVPTAAFTLFGAGNDNSGLVQWDVAGPTPEAPKK
jgi:hypothetical protein